MAASSCNITTSGHTYYRTNLMKLLTTLLASTAITNAAVVFDTRIDFDFNRPFPESPAIVTDNVGGAISMDFHEFDPRAIYMYVYNEVDRSQVVSSIDFSVDSRIAVSKATWIDGEAQNGKGGDGGEVDGGVKVFDDRVGRYDVSFDLRNPETTSSTGAQHSGGTSFTILWEFDEPTTTAEFVDAFFYDDWRQSYGVDIPIKASVADYGHKVDDVNDLTDFSLPFDVPGALFHLGGTVVPEPSSVMLGFLALLPLLRRKR